MTNPIQIQSVGVALNSEGPDVPVWIQLTPKGPEVDGRDGRSWSLHNPEAVVAAFRDNGADLPIDFEHATQIKGGKGEPAPAIGWIKDLEVRDRSIWAKVAWTETGQEAVASKSYRYVSPVFTFKKAAGDILAMVSAALTNQPNLQLAALNRQGVPEEPVMDKSVLEALGLTEGASAQDVLTAVNKLKADEVTARNRASSFDPAQFVPRADHDLALNKIRDFEADASSRAETAINGVVDAAIEAGKVSPASREYHIAACKADGGLEGFKKYAAASPEIAGDSGLGDKKPDAKTKTALSETELAVCRATGMSEKEFAEAKSQE